MFDRRARRADGADLRRQILAATVSEPQGRGWLVRVPLRMPHGLLRALVLALIAAAILGTALLGVGLLHVAPPTPTGLASEFIRPFEYKLPSNTTILPTAVEPNVFAWVAGPDIPASLDGDASAAEQARASSAARIIVASGEEAWIGGFKLRTRPEDFLADLRDLGNVPMSAVAETTLDGRRALNVMLPGADGIQVLYLSGPGLNKNDYLLMDLPERLTVADVDGVTVLVLIWAKPADALGAWLPIADEFVSSIHFKGGDQP
jgi:hypothetical protein